MSALAVAGSRAGLVQPPPTETCPSTQVVAVDSEGWGARKWEAWGYLMPA